MIPYKYRIKKEEKMKPPILQFKSNNTTLGNIEYLTADHRGWRAHLSFHLFDDEEGISNTRVINKPTILEIVADCKRFLGFMFEVEQVEVEGLDYLQEYLLEPSLHKIKEEPLLVTTS